MSGSSPILLAHGLHPQGRAREDPLSGRTVAGPMSVQVVHVLAVRPGEIVHHDDLNDPSNLIVFASVGEHTRHHLLGHCGLDDACPCDAIRLKDVKSDAAS